MPKNFFNSRYLQSILKALERLDIRKKSYPIFKNPRRCLRNEKD